MLKIEVTREKAEEATRIVKEFTDKAVKDIGEKIIASSMDMNTLSAIHVTALFAEMALMVVDRDIIDHILTMIQAEAKKSVMDELKDKLMEEFGPIPPEVIEKAINRLGLGEDRDCEECEYKDECEDPEKGSKKEC